MVQAPVDVRCPKGCSCSPGDVLRAGAQLRTGGVKVSPLTAALMLATSPEGEETTDEETEDRASD